MQPELMRIFQHCQSKKFRIDAMTLFFYQWRYDIQSNENALDSNSMKSWLRASLSEAASPLVSLLDLLSPFQRKMSPLKSNL